MLVCHVHDFVSYTSIDKTSHLPLTMSVSSNHQQEWHYALSLTSFYSISYRTNNLFECTSRQKKTFYRTHSLIIHHVIIEYRRANQFRSMNRICANTFNSHVLTVFEYGRYCSTTSLSIVDCSCLHWTCLVLCR
jgi:hypothetical protein